MATSAVPSRSKIDELYTPDPGFTDLAVYVVSDVNSIINQLRSAEVRAESFERRMNTALEMLRQESLSKNKAEDSQPR